MNLMAIALWDLCWRSTLLLILVSGLVACLPRRSLALRRFLIYVGMLSLLILPLSSTLPHIRLAFLPSARLSTSVTNRIGNQKLADHSANPNESVPVEKSNSNRQFRSAMPDGVPVRIPDEMVPLSDEAPGSTSLPEAIGAVSERLNEFSTQKKASQRSGYKKILFDVFWKHGTTLVAGVYLLGVLVCIGRVASGLLQLRRLETQSTKVNAQEWIDDLSEYSRVLGIKVRVQLRMSASVKTPLTFGWRNPILIVPTAMIDAADSWQRRAVLLHELSHVSQHDFVVQFVMRLLQAGYWCQTLVWVVAYQLRTVQEDLCDAECSAEFGADTYTRVLIDIVKSLKHGPQLTLSLAMARTSRLERRLNRIRIFGESAVTRLSLICCICLIFIASAVTAGLMLVQPVAAEQPAQAVASTVVPVVQVDVDPNADQDEMDDDDTDSDDQRISDDDEEPAADVDQGDSILDATGIVLDVAFPRVVFQLVGAKTRTPLAAQAVKLRRLLVEPRPFHFDDKTWETTSNDKGIVAVSIPDLPADLKEITLEVAAGDRAVEFEDIDIQHKAADKIPQVKLWPGQLIETRVFDADAQPADDARVVFLADVSSKNHTFWNAYATCNRGGTLSIRIPKNRQFGLTVTSDRGAPYRAVFTPGTETINEIHLLRGSAVAGRLLDREGKPVPNKTLVLTAEDSQAVDTELHVGHHGTGSLDINFHRTTDENGNFRFPPMTGPVQVYLDRSFRDKSNLPLIPVWLDLTTAGETWVPLMLSPVGTISGTVRMKEGLPAAKVEIEMLLPPRRSRTYTQMGRTSTDQDGRYQLEVPFPIDGLEVWCRHVRRDGQQYQGQPVGESDSGRRSGVKRLTRYVGEPLTLDWVLHPEKKEMDSKSRPALADDEWKPLAELELEIKRVHEKGEDTRNLTTDRCLQFEAEHRGTRMGLGALEFLVHAGEKAREKAVTIMTKHYSKHPDIDRLLSDLNAVFGAAGRDALFQKLANESPHDYVRAEALLEWAKSKFQLKNFKQNLLIQPEQTEKEFKLFYDMQTSQESKDYLLENRQSMQRLRAELDKVDDDALQQSALELLERLSIHFRGVAAPVRSWRSASDPVRDQGYSYPSLKLVDVNEDPTWRRRTAAERADILRYQKTRLQVGMTAPDIEGLDFHHRPIKLSQFRGKYVLLTTTRSNIERRLFATCAKILKSMKDEPFVCLSVIAGEGSGGYSANAIIRDGKVTWPIIRDSTENDIAHLWCQETFPSIYLIDPDGKILSLQEGDETSNLPALVRQHVKGPAKE